MSRARKRTALLDWKAVAGIALGIGLLAFSLRGVDIGAVWGEIRAADPFLFLASVAAATAPIVVRAWRWRALLEPVRPGTSFRARYESSMIGFMANNVLPARIGEFVRAYALSRMEPVPVVASFGSLVVERILDGVVIVGLLFLAMALPDFPAIGLAGGTDPGGAALVLLGVLGTGGVVLLAMVLRPERVVGAAGWLAQRCLPERLRRPAIDALTAFLAGLASLREPRLLARAVFWSVWVWLIMSFAFWLGFRAFGIDVSFTAALFLQSLVSLAVALPSAPGFFGLWEAAARVGLHDIWGVELDKALGFALGFHIGGFLSVTILGLYYAWRLGLSWSDVDRSTAVADDAVAARAADDAQPQQSAP